MSNEIKVIVPIVLGLIILLGIAWGVYAFVTNTPKNVKSYVNKRFINKKKKKKKIKR